ncbi:MAG: hypothetical protein AB7V43_21030 [Acidimicrobiia bacterium]
MDAESDPGPDGASAPWADRASAPPHDSGTSPERWLAGARADELIAERRARSVQTFLAVRETTLAGALAMAAEHGDTVTVWTRSQRQVSGPVVDIGADWLAIAAPQGRTWVTMASVDRVSSTHRRVGSRAVTGPKVLDALADQISPGDEVVVWTGGQAQVTGRFAGCGTDVLLVDGPRGRTLVGAQSVEVVLVGSG